MSELLGRAPMGRFCVTLRRADRSPMVLANDPLLFDGTPMPTRFWLCDPVLVKQVSSLESAGGVLRAEREVGLDEIARIHRRAAAERRTLIPDLHTGPAPFGGVAGTRRGVKCLHAHLANHLAGAPDAVGAWVERRLETQVRTVRDLPGIYSA